MPKQERLAEEAWENYVSHPHFWLMGQRLPLLALLALLLGGIGGLLGMPPLISFLLVFICLISIVPAWIWADRHYQQALRQTLLDAGIRPAYCFECGYDLEGYQGKACPACDAPLVRQAAPSSARS